ncbi:hypothetical protein QMZ62_05080 [Serratia sp. PF2-63]|uniref:hypothetical protein n=1 Tax=Serratia TaxID=613 RepID=UPI00217BBADD|nr:MULTISPECIES: hypothetical protein [Serratia]MDI6932149.1 hypothetical protein [Serratia sp. Se-PFBMAAmG]MDI6973363.1 hypothetical protein [Serratia sp. Se-RSBMAAmG]MDI9262332.1 hypothetical protein [Serratia sp. PF2-63]MDI9271184.1 hypothetical protein [Serratia sp. PF-27]CAI1534393.1 Uncharacterised protein [Serratia marcescens]
MWRRVTLGFPDNLAPISCSLLTVNPWTYGAGQVTPSGNYLSPENAVKFLAGKLKAAGGTPGAVGFLITATQSDRFLDDLAGFAALLPLPDLQKTTRKAVAQAELAVSKMQLPGMQGVGLPDVALLSLSTTRTAQNAQRIQAAAESAAAGLSFDDITSALQSLDEAASQAQQAAEQALTDLKGRRVDAWMFTDEGHPSNIANNMLNGIPEPDAIFTLGALFVGDVGELLRMVKP